MNRISAFLVGLLFALQACSQTTQDAGLRIDQLFSAFDNQSPGCAVGVVRDAKTVFAKAYGLADLEHAVPLSVDSSFYMASVSKQFMAMSILLLVEDGKLQLSDPLRQTISELPAYADPITIYHLLTHTSGIRDYLALGPLAGRHSDFVYTDAGVLSLISRQKALNFAPGSEYLYSNSGYVLLSQVVKRLAQKDLNDFARERIFSPLGMKSTRFQHNHSALIPGKAFGYAKRDSQWFASNSMLDVVGDGGLYSSVTDMLLWLRNFDTLRVGAKQLATMQTPAKLSSGKAIPYGMGLASGEYRGLKTIEHGGALAGYRTQVLRFPDHRLSVVCLCNNATANPGQLSRQVAEIYLSAQMKNAAPISQSAAERLPAAVVSGPAMSAQQMKAYSGEYSSDELETSFGIHFDGNVLSLAIADRTVPVTIVGVDSLRADRMELLFHRDAKEQVNGFALNAGRVRGIEFRRVKR